MNSPISKFILVLANSIKKGGRCVAGMEITSIQGNDFTLGDWIRPVDPTQDEGTIPTYTTFIGNRFVKPLDCVKIFFTGSSNDQFHPEDFEIDTSSKWEKVGTMTEDVFSSLPDESKDLWGADSATSRKVVPTEGIKTLRLIKPQDSCYVTAYREDTHWGVKHRRYLYILHRGIEHQFSIDDPEFTARHKLSPSSVGDRHVRIVLDPSRLVVIASLTKPLRGFQYKIAATIFEL